MITHCSEVDFFDGSTRALIYLIEKRMLCLPVSYADNKVTGSCGA